MNRRSSALIFLLLLAACALPSPGPGASPTGAPVLTAISSGPPAASEPPTASAPATQVAGNAGLPTAAPASPTAPPQPATAFPGTAVAFGPLSLVLPSGLASGASGTLVPYSEEGLFGAQPEHFELTLEGYALGDRFHQPKITVYDAETYSALQPAVATTLERLRAAANAPQGPFSPEQMPHVPFFNAGQVFAAQMKSVPFQNGQGLRMVTQYAQAFVTVNNNELFYHFQGLSSDGKSYIIAILPLTHPLLPEGFQYDAPVPPGGLAAPDINDPNADWGAYYSSVAAVLEDAAPDAFTPSLAQLDALIASIQTAPQ